MLWKGVSATEKRAGSSLTGAQASSLALSAKRETERASEDACAPVGTASVASFLQEPGVKGLGQQVRDINFLASPAQVRQNNLGLLGEHQNDLPAGAARRRQLLGIGDDHQIGKIVLTFGQRLPDRHALGADGQAVAGAFDIAAGENLSLLRSQRRAHKEFREWRH